MANYTRADILSGLSTVLATVSGIGEVVTRQRFAESDAQVAEFMESQQASGTACHGVIIYWVGCNVEEDDTVSQDRAIHSFRLQYLHPYDDTLATPSETTFQEVCEGIRTALCAARRLALDQRVRTRMPQSDGDAEILKSDARNLIVHRKKWTLDVEAVETYVEA